MSEKKYITKNPPLGDNLKIPLNKGESVTKGSRGIFSHNKLAFTLVELIVVVTILAILATIGFVSYSSYLTGVRDTNRLAQLVSIHDGLVLYSTKNELPLPDENIDVKIGGVDIIGYQGYAGSNTLETIDFTKGGQDPRDKSYFTYYLTKDRKFFQLMAFLEEEENITSLTPSPSPLEERGVYIASFSPKGEGIQGGGFVGLGLSSALAVNYESRVVTTYGKELGILTDISNQPVQEISGLSDVGEVDISSATDYRAYFDDETMFEGNGAELAAKVTLHVEHTSGFEPSDVSGLYMWFDANDSTTIEKTGNVITKWNDKSNNNNHFDVIEGDPTYGDLSINGSKTIYFDGTDSMHTTATFNAPYTIMYVAQMEGSQNGRVLGGDGNTLVGYHGGTKNDLYLSGWPLDSASSIDDTVDMFSLLRPNPREGTEFYSDGEQLSISNAGNGDFGKLWIGGAIPSGLVAREKSKVYFAEAIIFDRVISDNERKKIEAYLNKKWGPF